MAQLQDRRRHLRYPCETKVECRVGNARFPAHTRNLSSHGICLVLRRGLQGDFTVELPAELGHQERSVQVIYHREEAGDILIGGSFTEPLKNENPLASTVLAMKPLILVVEEEAGIRRLLRDGLEFHGVNIWPVASGLDAIAVYRRHHDGMALALIDVEMRRFDGPWTFAALRQINSEVRCWFMTGGAMEYPNDILLGMGADRVVRKPFSLTKLASELKAVCEAWPG